MKEKIKNDLNHAAYITTDEFECGTKVLLIIEDIMDADITDGECLELIEFFIENYNFDKFLPLTTRSVAISLSHVERYLGSKPRNLDTFNDNVRLMLKNEKDWDEERINKFMKRIN